MPGYGRATRACWYTDTDEVVAEAKKWDDFSTFTTVSDNDTDVTTGVIPVSVYLVCRRETATAAPPCKRKREDDDPLPATADESASQRPL